MIIRASKVIIEVGAYDELPSEVVNLPDESEYRCCLADMVPAGELEHGGLAEDVQNRETSREEVTKDEHKAIQEQPTGQSQSIQESTGVAGGDCLCCSSIRKWSTLLDETKLDFV